MVNKDVAHILWDKYNVFRYRKIVNDAYYFCDASILNEYAKEQEEKIISSALVNKLVEPFKSIAEITIKLSKLDSYSEEYYTLYREKNSLMYDLDDYANNMIANAGNNGLEEELIVIEQFSNNALSNYIIDYHFEENYYNIMYDVRELLSCYYAGNISLPMERVNLYFKIDHIDELPIEDKLELHEELKQYNMIEQFYDDMSFARQIVRDTIKNDSLTKDALEQYKDIELSNEYGVPVYTIGSEPFVAIVKTGTHSKDDLPTGHSFSLVGSGCIGVFGDVSNSQTFLYDSKDLNSEQIVHIFPKDSFTLYRPMSSIPYSTNCIQTIMTADELLQETNAYNEVLILEKGTTQTDMDKRIPELKKMALYCYDKITKQDVEVATENGVGIFLVNTKEYDKGIEMPSSIYRHSIVNFYWEYNYFDGVNELDKHERQR